MIESNILQKQPRILDKDPFERQANIKANKLRSDGYTITGIYPRKECRDDGEYVTTFYEICGYK